MADEILKHDWYKVLGCVVGDTKEQINKACRKLSLKYHPDKNPSKSAEEMFLMIQKAKETLLDDTLRANYDAALKKVQKRKQYDEQRKGTMDASKKRMRDELEQRMRNATSARPQGPDSDAAKRLRQQNIESIRQENRTRMESHHEESMKRDEEHRQQVAAAAMQRSEKDRVSAGSHDFSVCLKVKWRKSDTSQSEDSLVNVFKAYGNIESVEFGVSRGSSAIIVFQSAKSIDRAVEGMDGSSIYKVSKIEDIKQGDIFSHKYNNSGHSTTGSDTSSDLMSHVRRAVEREKLLRMLPEEVPGVPEREMQQNDVADKARGVSAAFPISATPEIVASVFAGASALKDKESDILKRMMEASLLKKEAAAEEKI